MNPDDVHRDSRPISKFDGESEELDTVDLGDLGLVLVQSEFQSPFQVFPASLHDPRCPFLRRHQNDDIVRIPHEPVSPLLHGPVELVEIDVGKQRGEVPALRGPLIRCLNQSIDHHSALEEALDEYQQGLVLDIPAEDPHEQVVIDGVEVLRQIDVDRPGVTLVAIVPQSDDCVLGPPSRSESETPVGELGFVYRRQHLCHRLLYGPVQYGGDSEIPLPSVGFGNDDPPYWLRFIVSRT